MALEGVGRSGCPHSLGATLVRAEATYWLVPHLLLTLCNKVVNINIKCWCILWLSKKFLPIAAFSFKKLDIKELQSVFL